MLLEGALYRRPGGSGARQTGQVSARPVYAGPGETTVTVVCDEPETLGKTTKLTPCGFVLRPTVYYASSFRKCDFNLAKGVGVGVGAGMRCVCVCVCERERERQRERERERERESP